MKFHDRRKKLDTKENNYLSDDYALKQLVNMNRPDWLLDRDLKDLIRNYDNENTYLDIVLKSYLKDNTSVNISSIRLFLERTDISIIAKIYTIYAKYDLDNYLPQLDETILLRTKNNKTLLEYLLMEDVLLCLNRIIPERLFSNSEVYSILELNGFHVTKKPNFEILPDDFNDICSNYGNSKYNDIVTDSNFERKLFDLSKALLKSGSDKSLVDSVLKSYRAYYHNNREYANKELDNANNEFSRFPIRIQYGKRNHYSRNARVLSVRNNSIQILGHEFGHAVFMSMSDTSYSEEFEYICERIRNNPNTVPLVDEFSKTSHEAKNKIRQRVNDTWNRQRHIKIGDEREISNYLSRTKDIQKSLLKRRGYNQEDVDILVDRIYTKEEYLRVFENTRKAQMVSMLFSSEFVHIEAVSDIIDAVYKGRFNDGKIDGVSFIAVRGHGINYYTLERTNALDEVMANYAQLLKSLHYQEGIKLLTNILGIEFVSTMDKIYREQVINSRKVFIGR